MSAWKISLSQYKGQVLDESRKEEKNGEKNTVKGLQAHENVDSYIFKRTHAQKHCCQ